MFRILTYPRKAVTKVETIKIIRADIAAVCDAFSVPNKYKLMRC